VRVHDEDEAVRRANEEGVNLTASVWTRDRSKAQRVASKLRAGTVSINDHGSTGGAPWTPWGGVGESGYGRLNGKLGLREFVVPVHISRNTMPAMKRLWWYPYDEATSASFRGLAELLSAPGVGKKLSALRAVAGSAASAMKNKL
jgi:delta 1-pyrroline-5-carboxylate dehydrogenase